MTGTALAGPILVPAGFAAAAFTVGVGMTAALRVAAPLELLVGALVAASDGACVAGVDAPSDGTAAERTTIRARVGPRR